MDVLRTAVSMLSLYDPAAADNSQEANSAKAVKLMARVPTIVTSFDRLRNGKEVIPGDPGLGYAANFLYTLSGKKPDDLMERVFDVALILHADHELNASTFAGRVTAATLSDIYSAVTSAIGALKGPLHGGANEAVIQMLLSTKSPDDAVAIAYPPSPRVSSTKPRMSWSSSTTRTIGKSSTISSLLRRDVEVTR